MAFLVVALVLAAGAWRWGTFRVGHSQPPDDKVVDLDRFEATVIMPSKPAFVDPPRVAAADSDARPEELVLGIELGGETRAYPLNMLSGPIREILNDTLGGEPIAVTWCDYCHDGIVFSRRVESQVLTLIVDGSMWEQSMVIRDEPTGTLWSQLLGKGMQGALAGRMLEVIPAVHTTWSDWKRRHPDTTVVQLPREQTHYTREYHLDRRRFVLGLKSGADAGAVTFHRLEADPVINVVVGGEPLVVTYDDEHTAARVFSRRVGRETLDFTAAPRHQMLDVGTGSVWDAGSGECVRGALQGERLSPRAGVVAYASVWKRFHPDSRDLSNVAPRSRPPSATP